MDLLFDGRLWRALELLPEPLRSDQDPLRATEWLRARLGAELGREAGLLHALRLKARGRFPHAERGCFTRKGLEQCSRLEVARFRAERIAGLAPRALIWDASCGIGGDTVALAACGLRVVASDPDLRTARCARSNLQSLQLPAWVLQARAEDLPARADFVLLDPDRRAEGRRSLEPSRWSPTLAQAVRIGRAFRGACLKLPPSFDAGAAGAREWAERPCRWQWISSGGELREVAQWTGELADCDREELRDACVLAPAQRQDAWASHHYVARSAELVAPGEVGCLDSEAAARVQWLAEPDPALIRSGLLGRFARERGWTPIGPRLAYLACEGPVSTPLARVWRVVETSPLDRKLVRRMLGRHDVGPVTVMKRGHPDPAEALAKRFRGPGARAGLLAIARLEHGHLALLLAPPP